jgi:biotin carboxylase
MAKGYNSPEEASKDVSLFHWPVIVKPTDSAGSKGVTRVDEPSKLAESINYALKFSHSNEFIIEDFLVKKGQSSDTDSFSVDGELAFVSFSAQRFDEKAENPYTPSAYSWPSTFAKESENELKEEIQRLLRLLKMRTSIYNIETRECTDGKAYIMELSPRGGGNRLSEMLRYATGVDLITNAVRAAVGLPVVDVKQKDYDGCWAELILHSDKPGLFKELVISESLPAEIIEKDLWVNVGDQVGGFSGANEAIGTLVLKFENSSCLDSVMSKIDKYIAVKIEN